MLRLVVHNSTRSYYGDVSLSNVSRSLISRVKRSGRVSSSLLPYVMADAKMH